MKSVNRDLLLLSRKAAINKEEMEYEVEKLHQLLFHVECLENFCKVNEIIDVDKRRIISNPVKMEKLIKQKKLHPFQFINNVN
jgi:hypothetical protein